MAPYTYYWEDEAASMTNVYENLFPGDYMVRIVDAGGCEIELVVTVQQFVAVAELPELQLTIAPNPSPDYVTVRWSPELVVKRVSLVNNLGVRIPVTLLENSSTPPIYLPNVGIFWIELQLADGRSFGKPVVRY